MTELAKFVNFHEPDSLSAQYRYASVGKLGQGQLINLYGDLAGILNISKQEKYEDEIDLTHIRMVVGFDASAIGSERATSPAELLRALLPPFVAGV